MGGKAEQTRTQWPRKKSLEEHERQQKAEFLFCGSPGLEALVQLLAKGAKEPRYASAPEQHSHPWKAIDTYS